MLSRQCQGLTKELDLVDNGQDSFFFFFFVAEHITISKTDLQLGVPSYLSLGKSAVHIGTWVAESWQSPQAGTIMPGVMNVHGDMLPHWNTQVLNTGYRGVSARTWLRRNPSSRTARIASSLTQHEYVLRTRYSADISTQREWHGRAVATEGDPRGVR